MHGTEDEGVAGHRAHDALSGTLPSPALSPPPGRSTYWLWLGGMSPAGERAGVSAGASSQRSRPQWISRR